ncbi:stAR-related lipid transfer protein 5 isoform X1 [Neolamprologus brichardi]|uniref:StAR related lipid transfer domain containing 5 n=1 Tax=Neolamprologus brichardi TaxID=32507 RepID=A0A3Q4H7Z4_NEOBR|nr:stAR-related lipid transfer protein 5 isoform X1 [Neolamprologus brichardi]
MRMFLQVAFITECFASVVCVRRSTCFLIQQCGSPAFIIFSPDCVPLSDYTGSYKGDGIVNGTPDKVWECLKPVPNGLRVKWDNNVKRFEVLEQITEDISICRTVTPSAAMGIIAPRDFVDVILIKQYEDGSISSNATNTIHPSCAPQSGYVRGFNHPCGCICVPVSGEPNKTQVLTFFQTDLGGYLPRSVVDSFFPSSMAEFYSNLAKSVKSLKDF